MTAERQWIFPMDSKADVVMPDGVHRYWSTHCRHGNHADCKGSCKICASPCLCAGCMHQIPLPVEGSTPLDPPAPARPRGLDALLGYVADRLDAAPAGEVASGDVVEAIMDTIHAYPGPVAGRTGAHVERLIREYAAGQRAEGVEEGRRQAGDPALVPPPVDALLKLIDRAAHCNTCDNPAINPVDEEEIESMVRALFAAGVVEGRRQATGRPAYQRGDDCPTCGASGDDHG